MEKKQKKTPLITPILWFIAFIIWTVSAVLKISSPYAEESTAILSVLAALANLITALVWLWRWKRDRNDPDKVDF